MKRRLILVALSLATALAARYGFAGQAPAAASDPDIPISHQDRVYSAEQYSNTVSVTDPVDNKLLGTIRLGDPLPANFSPLYRGQLLVHGMGFSPDHRTIAVVAIGGLNEIKVFRTDNFQQVATIPVGRLPHGVWPSGDGTRVYVGLENEDKVAAIDTLKNEVIATSPVGMPHDVRIFRVTPTI